MVFRTELNIAHSGQKIYHKDLILLIGSCFSKNIGEQLHKCKFNVICNPFGTVFHPVSIARLIRYVCTKKTFDKKELILVNGNFVHPDFHSVLSHEDAEIAILNLNHAVAAVQEILAELRYIFITPGTAIGYKLKENKSWVTNCHKLPAKYFDKEVVSEEEAVSELSEAILLLKNVNPDIKVIFTISPVRHIKDGIVENSRSKARLVRTVERLQSEFENIDYFPAYEWMMDDLRDYRFYNSDMIHPNEQAITYIWEKFVSHYFDDYTKELIREINKITTAANHIPFSPDSKSHHDFQQKVRNDIEQLNLKYPWLDFKPEKDQL
jgi:hypothetical protein